MTDIVKPELISKMQKDVGNFDKSQLLKYQYFDSECHYEKIEKEKENIYVLFLYLFVIDLKL